MMTDYKTDKVILRGKENFEVWKFQYEICVNGKKDNERQKFIVCTVTENVLRKLTTCKSSKSMMEKLESMYGVSTEINKLYLQNKFFSMKCDSNVLEFVEEIDNVASRLEEAGELISDQMITAKILNTLPKSFEAFVTAFECSNDMSSKNLRAKLMVECERRSLKRIEADKEYVSTKEKVSEEKAFISKDSKVSRNYCKRSGHFIKDCEVLKKKNESTKCFKCGRTGHIAKYCHEKSEDKLKFVATALSASADHLKGLLKNQWIVDSGATQHMIHDRELFVSYQPSVESKEVIMPNVNSLKVCGTGEVTIFTEKVELTLKNVLYIPEIKFNLLATKPLTDNGVEVLLSNEGAKFLLNNEVIMYAAYKYGLYVLDCDSVNLMGYDLINLTLYDWHVRLGHQNLKYVRDILKKEGILYKNDEFECEHCKLGKMSQKPFQNSISWAENVGDLIHMDVGGPMEVPSLGRNRYYLLLRDDYTNWRTVYFMKEKSEVRENIVAYLNWFKTQTGVNIKKFRSDNGLEEVNKRISDMLTDLGIIYEKTCPYTPEQNGRIEPDNRTIIESARTMLISANLNKNMWAEATNVAVFVLNRTGRTRVSTKTPIELFFKKSPNLKFLKPYGAEVFVHIPKSKRKKWDAKARKGRFVGYEEETKGYRIYFPDKRSVEIHRDVDFMESNNETALIHAEEKLTELTWENRTGETEDLEEDNHNVSAIEHGGRSKEVPLTFEEINQRNNALKRMNAVEKELEAKKVSLCKRESPRKKLCSLSPNSEEQTADIFTKPLGKAKFVYFRRKLKLL